MSTDMLYQQDFVTWTERQAEALRQAGRQGSNLSIECDRVAEEVEHLGNEVLHKIENLTIFEPACSSTGDLRLGWTGEIQALRDQLPVPGTREFRPEEG